MVDSVTDFTRVYTAFYTCTTIVLPVVQKHSASVAN